jgi:hypothetical protein
MTRLRRMIHTSHFSLKWQSHKVMREARHRKRKCPP